MRFSPGHPEYARFVDIYVDESSQTKHRYLLIGALMVPTPNIDAFVQTIWRARAPELPAGEMKWTKVSRAKLPAYKRVVDVFFDNKNSLRPLDFHCLHVDTSRIDDKRDNEGSREIGFSKDIHRLLMKCGRMHKKNLFHLYPDERGRPQSAARELGLIFNRALKKDGDRRDWPCRRSKYRDSKSTICLQVVDILLGAVAYELNGHAKAAEPSPAKTELSRYILRDRWHVISHVLDGTSWRGRYTIWPVRR
jgi:hypothetical protein